MSYLFWCFLLFSAILVNGRRSYVNVPMEYTADIVAASIDCIQKTGMPVDLLQQLIDWNFKGDTNKLGKFLYCFGNTSGFADKNGLLKTDMMAKLVEKNPRKNQFVDVLNECNKLVGKDKYDTALKVSICYHDNSPIWLTL